MTLAAWVLAALLQFAPLDRLPRFEGFAETQTEAQQRYVAIADDIAAVAEEDERKPGGLSDHDEAALLVALAIGETHLALDTDEGSPGCYRGKPGGPWWTRCDSGTSATLWQLKPVLWEGQQLGYRELFTDRRRAARIELRAARGSLWRCRRLDPVDRLSALGGGCHAGGKSAQDRYRSWMQIRAWAPR